MSNKNLYKYPRTPHLPWSDSVSKDDQLISIDNLNSLLNKKIIMTLKMDGENTSMYNNHIHARSMDSKDHKSRHWIKSLHAYIKNMIPDGWRICGENLFAKHSILYKELPSYFMVFSVWNEKNECLSFPDTLLFISEINLNHVPVIFNGYLDKNDPVNHINNIFHHYTSKHEGYVIRSYESFHYNDFNQNVVKYVRPNHIQTDKHWMNQPIIKNGLME